MDPHANSHFEVEDEDEQLAARDLEFAQQLALAPSSPPSSSMTRTTFYEIEHGLMALLRDCLESERGNTTSIVSGSSLGKEVKRIHNGGKRKAIQRGSLSRPLYFQHDGHSRTVVGIQVKHQHNGMQQHNLLILDPGHRTADLERSLKQKVGWQKFIKRGVHTLKKPQYQLCYIDTGIANREEVELLKTIESVFLEF
ncbi:Peptidase C78, ubiquitin fold modifier-specific peptidase 1/ 2 [Prunus dulcis]|uniref:Peptidase C78, ubiquitin fold modifier-specific peptidase 1/ 2 n=1 Tax=Prunus dulcis TaxID=3755 RepID=A0A4Y1R2Z8_PRUDU|nr:Peptidase C78, ubiquitin fold modifier-specific peptidase 1/ 2 [Prunus dulcis]